VVWCRCGRRSPGANASSAAEAKKPYTDETDNTQKQPLAFSQTKTERFLLKAKGQRLRADLFVISEISGKVLFSWRLRW